MLEVDNISLYYGAAQALRGVSLKAEPGKVTCVLGRNGVGKTSLLRALVGQHAISSGSIKFDGADLGAMRPYERARRGIAFVPQGREIFPLLTVEENLKTGFAAINRDKTVMVVEHDMTFVRELGVKVTCLHEGTVLAEGTIDDVSTNERVIEVYLGR